MNIYTYSKSGTEIKEVPFIEMIRLDSNLYSKLYHVEITYSEETKVFDTVTFKSEHPLDIEDQQKCIDYVQNWSEMNMQCAMYNMRNLYQNDRMKKGRDIISRIAVLNQYNDKPLENLYMIYQPEPAGDLGLLNIIDSGAFEMAYINTAKMEKAIIDGTPNSRWTLEELGMVKAWISWEIEDAMVTQLQMGVDGGMF